MEAKQLTQQTKNDVMYLREYIAFGSSGPVIIGECLHKEFLNAHANSNFNRAAHFQLRLHAEMVMCLESFGAMLLAYTRWDKPRGIIGALLDYKPGEVPDFIDQLNVSNYQLSLFCFPGKDVLLEHDFDMSFIANNYSSEGLQKHVAKICGIYLVNDIRHVYNKIKHSGICITQNPPGYTVANSVFLIMEDIASEGKFPCAEFNVTGKEGIDLVNIYLKNIQQIMNESKGLANFVAYCLENNLMLPSQ